MSNEKLRRQITCEAARLMYVRQESEYYRAKMKAARNLGCGWVRPDDLPTNREIRDEIQSMARMQHNGLARPEWKADGAGGAEHADRFRVYRMLLAPLETVRQNPETHPEGDALYHSLQVFELARNLLPYDEEFLLAALLHDVGKAIDPRNHVAAGLEALAGTITPRTAWLIEHHSEAGALRDGTLGARARRRLEASPDFDDLMLLCDCDRGGRERGAAAPELDEALDALRQLAHSDGAS